jgi:hypothetical protein
MATRQAGRDEPTPRALIGLSGKEGEKIAWLEEK